jgi:serine/threonine protein kinase
MEYCEKSTLRDTIDQGLHEDSSRLWRLFREILDGLAYIHEQVCVCLCVSVQPPFECQTDGVETR